MSANNVVCVYEEIPLDPYITHVVDTYSSIDHKHGARCDDLLLKKVPSNRLGVDAGVRQAVNRDQTGVKTFP